MKNPTDAYDQFNMIEIRAGYEQVQLGLKHGELIKGTDVVYFAIEILVE